MFPKLLTEAPLTLLSLLLSCEASYEETWDTRFPDSQLCYSGPFILYSYSESRYISSSSLKPLLLVTLLQRLLKILSPSFL